MLLVAVHVPGVCAVVSWRTIPVFETGFFIKSVTDLLHPTKARRRPIEQRTKPIKTRGLKKADREKELFCIAIYLKLCERTLTFHGFPGGKRARWLGWSRLTDLARPQNVNYAEK